jgi:N-methylhydantoinase B
MSEPLPRIDDNLVLGRDGSVRCRHCDAVTGSSRGAPLDQAVVRVGSPSLAGPQVTDNAALFVDREMEFRQRVCPQCFTALQTEVVPADEESVRGKSL